MAQVIVITGPSGVGKGTVIRLLREKIPSIRLSISATTREPRPGERDGVDYYFLTAEQFDALVSEAAFAEHARYAGQQYGTLLTELQREGDGDGVVMLEIELQGARQIRGSMSVAYEVRDWHLQQSVATCPLTLHAQQKILQCVKASG